MELDEFEGGGGGGGAPPPVDDAAARARLAHLAGAVFGDPHLAAAVLSHLRMDEARSLRAAGSVTRAAVAVFAWEWRAQRPPRVRALVGARRMRRWRRCFPRAASVVVTDGGSVVLHVRDEHVALLAGVADVTLVGCAHLTDAAIAPLARTIRRLRIRRCPLTTSIFACLAGDNVQAVDVRGLESSRSADLVYIPHVKSVLLDAQPIEEGAVIHADDVPYGDEMHCDDDDEYTAEELEDVHVVTDAGLGVLSHVRHLRVPVGGFTYTGLMSVRSLEALELLLPAGVRPSDVYWLLAKLPPKVTRLALLRTSDDAPLVPVPLEVSGLDAPLSRLTALRLDGLGNFDGALLRHTRALERLDVAHCAGVDAANFSPGLDRLQHLRLTRCGEWAAALPFQDLASLETLTLANTWPGAAAMERLRGLRALRFVSYAASFSDDYDHEMAVLQAFHGLGAGSFRYVNADGVLRVAWTAARPLRCPCCGRSGAEGGGGGGCDAWRKLRAKKPRVGVGGGGWGGAGDSDDDE